MICYCLKTCGYRFHLFLGLFLFQLHAELMFQIKGLGFFMVRTPAVIDLAVVVDDLLGSLLDPVKFLFFLLKDFFELSLEGAHFFVELISPAMEMF